MNGISFLFNFATKSLHPNYFFYYNTSSVFYSINTDSVQIFPVDYSVRKRTSPLLTWQTIYSLYPKQVASGIALEIRALERAGRGGDRGQVYPPSHRRMPAALDRTSRGDLAGDSQRREAGYSDNTRQDNISSTRRGAT